MPEVTPSFQVGKQGSRCGIIIAELPPQLQLTPIIHSPPTPTLHRLLRLLDIICSSLRSRKASGWPLRLHNHSYTSAESSITMSGAPATFFAGPIRYIRWAFHEKPAIAFSILIGSIAPTVPIWVPPLRRRLGDEDPPPIPHSYPGTYIPNATGKCKG